MNKKILKFSLVFFLYCIFAFPKPASAVIPPDFVFNIGMQIAQFFSVIMLFFAAVFGTLFQFFRNSFNLIKHKKFFLVAAMLSVIAVSLISSYFYATYKQKAEYKKWLEESKKYEISKNVPMESENISESKGNPDEKGENIYVADENDQLKIGKDANKNISTSSDRFVSKIDPADSSAKFINEYYENIANGNLEKAYVVSKKTVALDVFKSWYANTTKITMDKLVRIDEKKSSLELTLFEGNAFTRYGVLMTLNLQGLVPIRVEKSEVKILAQGAIENNSISISENDISQEYAFFNSNENKNILITNQEFKNITDSEEKDYVVLDARENIEYENGYFPGSTHVRFADLKAGRWIEIPKDKFIYVICWSGIRGKEVAEFLRTKKIVASYLENGANGWVDFGGKWIGNIKFGEKYAESRFQIVFSTDEVEEKAKEGVVLVDTREPYKYKQSHIAGSISIPIMYTPTINMENVFNQVSPKSSVITVCDGYVNCFDAKITGVELERRGHQFLGRYNKPWEYGK